MRAILYFMTGVALAATLNACAPAPTPNNADNPASTATAAATAIPAAAAESRAVVEAFYAMHIKEDTSGVPEGEALARYQPYLSKRLNGLMLRALKERDEAIAAHPDEKPPYVDGDMFSSLFEGPTGFAVGASPDPAKLPVTFTNSQPGQEATHWTDTVLLVKEDGAWKIDDVEFGGQWEFASRGRLSKSLEEEQH